MSSSKFEPWSDNPNAPNIPSILYHAEKAGLAGILIGSILYGVLIVLSFQCIAALFNPVNRGSEGIKWGVVFYTVIMLSFATVHTATKGQIFSISYIDNREFHGGPYIYQAVISSEAIVIVSSAAFCVNNWLADGLLLYRCYLFYSKNLWVISFPFLMYLGSVAAGILSICPTISFITSNIACYSISLSLNVILTLMIAVQLILRGRDIRAAMGSPVGIGGLYKSIATILVESSALFAVSSLLVIGLWAAKNPVANAFTPILSKTQVIASLLIIKRVANKSALKSSLVAPGSIRQFKGSTKRGSAGASGRCSLPGGHTMRSTGEYWTSASEYGVGDETMVDIHREKV